MLSTISLRPVIDRMSSLHICCVPGKAICQFSACTFARTVCLKYKLHAFLVPHVVQKKNMLLIWMTSCMQGFAVYLLFISCLFAVYLLLLKWILSVFVWHVKSCCTSEAEFIRRHLNLHLPVSMHCMDLNSSQASGLGAPNGCACTIKFWM